MKTLDWFFLFVIVTVGVTLGNLVALKIAADQIRELKTPTATNG